MTHAQAIPLVAALAIPFGLLYALGRFARWYVGRRDPVDALIAQNAPRWRKDGGAYMNTCDHQKLNRAGELRWQETLRAQRRTRKPQRKPRNVFSIASRRSA